MVLSRHAVDNVQKDFPFTGHRFDLLCPSCSHTMRKKLDADAILLFIVRKSSSRTCRYDEELTLDLRPLYDGCIGLPTRSLLVAQETSKHERDDSLTDQA